MTAHILKFLTPGIFFLALTGCDNSTSAESQQLTQALVKRSLDNMVPVAGGEFLMGDFGPLIWEKLPFSSNQDDKYLHKVSRTHALGARIEVLGMFLASWKYCRIF
ncbi:hypothetical protein L6310_03835 [Citrobacter portucalensis]|nr:hypothetical protein [Citrobacter freundii]UKK89293.1 hypothetical protein L6310_03835 [Citrobacter portucalensis]